MAHTVFVSAVTSEFGAERDRVDAALRSVSFVTRFQPVLEVGSSVLLEKLRVEMRRCDSAVFLIGEQSGSVPTEAHQAPFTESAPFRDFMQTTGAACASLTQWEFLFALEWRMPMYVLFRRGSEPEQTPAGRARAGDLQFRFRQWIGNRGIEYQVFTDAADLELTVVKLPLPRRVATTLRAPLPAARPDDLPGLRALDGADAGLYFGRSSECALAREHLSAQGFVAVVGGSGSGKSSLLQAGVLPTLLVPGKGGVSSASMVPGRDPFLALAKLFLGPAEAADELAASLRRDPDRFEAVHRRHCLRTNADSIVVIVEQFEELFALDDERVARDFIGLVVGAVRSRNRRGGAATQPPSSPPSFALTLRADFFAHCLAHAGLLDLFQRGTLLLGEPSDETVKDIVDGIADQMGLELPGELRERLVDDVRQLGSGRLVMLAYTLRALHRESRRDQGVVSMRVYREIGGVAGAIATRAAAAFERFDDASEDRRTEAMHRLFAELVQVEGNGQPLRRRVREATFADDPAAVRLIETFAAPDVGLLTRSNGLVEVTHETLFERVDVYREWIAGHREALMLASAVEKAARSWTDAGRQAHGLWPPHRSLEARDRIASVPAIARRQSEAARAFLDPKVLARGLFAELDEPATREARRHEIGRLLREFVDPAAWTGVAALDDGTPDIAWCRVEANPTLRVPSEDTSYRKPVEAFFIARFPVTVAQFRAFSEDAAYADDAWWGGVEPMFRSRPEFTVPGHHPAAPVTWFQAMAYARWVDRRLPAERRPVDGPGWQVRLPTEWEWLQAASGGDGRRYPWGDAPKTEAVRKLRSESAASTTIPVGLFPAGAAPCGAQDMVGNAFEWTLNLADGSRQRQYPHEHRSVRGGTFDSHRSQGTCAYRISREQTYSIDNLGFRLALASGDPDAMARLSLRS